MALGKLGLQLGGEVQSHWLGVELAGQLIHDVEKKVSHVKTSKSVVECEMTLVGT